MSLIENVLQKHKLHAERILEGSDRKIIAAATSSSVSSAVQPQPGPGDVPMRTTMVPVNIAHLRELGLAPPEDFQLRQQNQLRVIKRQLLEIANTPPEHVSDPPNNLISVTSSLPGEGKTFISMSLALSIATELDHKVVLVDADHVKRNLSHAFGLENAQGLTDLLRNPSIQAMDCIHPTSIRGLFVMPAGSTVDGVTELLSSDRARKIMLEMGMRWPQHIILFDTPPALLTAETQVLAKNSGQLLFVVRAGVSLQDLVREALTRFDGIVTPSLVLNGWQPVLPSDKQYYYTYSEYHSARSGK
jgi:receptor protein-tyrosine kinase